MTWAVTSFFSTASKHVNLALATPLLDLSDCVIFFIIEKCFILSCAEDNGILVEYAYSLFLTVQLRFLSLPTLAQSLHKIMGSVTPIF